MLDVKSWAVGRKLLRAFAALPPSMAVALLAVVLGLPASAHHSWARYDGDNVITITGNVGSAATSRANRSIPSWPDVVSRV